MCLSAFVLWAFAHGCENSRIYLDKVFRTGVQDGGNLGEDGSLSVPIPGHIHLQSPPFRHRLRLHPKPLHGALLYLYIQYEKKHKTQCTWLPNGLLRGQAGVAACLFTDQHNLPAHPNAINPRQRREGETGRGGLEQPSFYLHHTNCFIQERR